MPTAEARVALLARPGVAATRVREALAQAGASVVLDADPTDSGLSALVDAEAAVVVVVLDPAVEDAIDRFEPVLGDRRVDVIYEEADLVAGRDGWDLARWQRHLVAKLQRHADVLPPLPEAPMATLSWGDAQDDDTRDSAGAAPQAPALAVEAAVAEAVAEATGTDATDAWLSLEGTDAVPATLLADDVAGAGLGAREPQAPSHAFDPALAEYDFDTTAAAPVAPFTPDAPEAATPVFGGDGDFVFEGVDGLGLDARADAPPPAHDSPFDPTNAEDLDWQPPAALQDAGVLDFDASLFETPVEADSSVSEAPAPEPASAMPVPAIGTSGLTLVLDDPEAPVAADPDTTRARFRHDLDDLHARIATLELVDDTPRRGPETPRGAVLVMAGIGGPDAVRQLLGALPAEFPRPVLVQQRLDGGRYDKLVAQMQRAAAMTVRLAEAGQPVIAGVVYILPDTLGLDASGEPLRFSDAPGDLLAALPSSDSAVLLFSGSDASVVDAVMNHKWAGAFVAGQTPDGCYDASAPAALVARGAEAGPPADLAAQLVARWS